MRKVGFSRATSRTLRDSRAVHSMFSSGAWGGTGEGGGGGGRNEERTEGGWKGEERSNMHAIKVTASKRPPMNIFY